MGKGVGLGSGVTDFEARLFLPSLLDNRYHLAWRRRGAIRVSSCKACTRVTFTTSTPPSVPLAPDAGALPGGASARERDLLQLSRYVYLNRVHTQATRSFMVLE